MFWVVLEVLIGGGAFVWLSMLKAWKTGLEGAFKELSLIMAGLLGFFGWRRYRGLWVGKLPIPAAPLVSE